MRDTLNLDAVAVSVPTGLFIDGHWRPSASGSTMAVENPATREVLAHVADADLEDAHAAVEAAAGAQEPWAQSSPRERADILRRAGELIQERGEAMARVMTAEMGKPLAEARGEVAYGAEFFRWFAEEATRIDGNFGVTPDGATRMITMRRPVGPCLLITPWNFPLAMGTRTSSSTRNSSTLSQRTSSNGPKPTMSSSLRTSSETSSRT
jgi:succinate-semialdehyde dehydrogenase/glutarate-semialdehyde dehydrogenase